MESKVLEVRDSGTFIPVLATKLGSGSEQERWLLAMAGFGRSAEDHGKYVVLVKIHGGEPCDAHIDPFAWGRNPRTYFVAHDFICSNWDSIRPGDVVDVQHILGETDRKKTSDRFARALRED